MDLFKEIILFFFFFFYQADSLLVQPLALYLVENTIFSKHTTSQ